MKGGDGVRRTSTLQLVMTGLFAGLVCVSTLCVRVPSPAGGYVNLGDGVMLLGAWLLGPGPGALAAGMGAMLADVLGGFALYAPGSLMVKGLAALLAGHIMYRGGKDPHPTRFSLALGGLAGEAAMVLGYFLYAALCLGYGPGAAAALPGDCVQGALGVLILCGLQPLVRKARLFMPPR